MSYYKTCEDCGANLDPGEKCDCKDIPSEDCLIIGMDFSKQRDRMVIVTSRQTGDRVEVLNTFWDDEARELYSKLTNNIK